MKCIYRKIKISSILAIITFTLVLSGCGSNPKYKHGKTTASNQIVVATAKVQYSHRVAGINLPRTTGQQFKAAKRISRKYLKAGDLVFFKTSLSRSVSHVGIYLGKNKFIHAPSSGKRVKISSMQEKYWRKRFTGAGRIL